jgi:predicted TIM-barrel fold metal-dependent hydrolase
MSTADLIDVHAHFFTAASGRGDWREVNEARLEAGAQMGVTAHVASILGTWGASSPTYFPSPDDVTHGNDAMVRLTGDHPGLVFGYCVVNPNYPDHALQELSRRVDEGMIGIKLAASRRANDPLLDSIAAFAAEHELPILQHSVRRGGAAGAGGAAPRHQVSPRPSGWWGRLVPHPPRGPHRPQHLGGSLR